MTDQQSRITCSICGQLCHGWTQIDDHLRTEHPDYHEPADRWPDGPTWRPRGSITFGASAGSHE